MYREEMGLGEICKSKAQLFRDIKVGMIIRCDVDCIDRRNDGERLKVISKGSQVIVLENSRQEEVRLYIPRTCLMEYVGTSLVVYSGRERGLNPLERQALENVVGAKESMRRNYLKKVGYGYLYPGVMEEGKSLTKGNRVLDVREVGEVRGVYTLPGRK